LKPGIEIYNNNEPIINHSIRQAANRNFLRLGMDTFKNTFKTPSNIFQGHEIVEIISFGGLMPILKAWKLEAKWMKGKSAGKLGKARSFQPMVSCNLQNKTSPLEQVGLSGNMVSPNLMLHDS
jgi:hypothetical protein